ncbi:MAG: isochorismatase family protein [Salinigranum sp.]
MTDRFEEAYVPDVVPEEDIEYFRKSGFGARLGWGERAAVVVVDMTNQFASGEYPFGRGDTGAAATRGIERLLEAAREAGLHVFYTVGPNTGCNVPSYRGIMGENKADGPSYDPDEGNQIVDALAPEPGDTIVEKPGASAFFETHLASMLRFYDVDTLIVTGMTTSGCVRATAVDAFCSNVYPIVPIECVADRSGISHEIALFDVDMKYGDVEPLDDVLGKLEDHA